jgi:hypothetical protein
MSGWGLFDGLIPGRQLEASPQMPIGASGFEPLTSWSQARRANQTALRPGASLSAQHFEEPFKIVVGLEPQDDLPLVSFAEADLHSRRQALP